MLQPMKINFPSWIAIAVSGILATIFATLVLTFDIDVLVAFTLVSVAALGVVVAMLSLAFIIAAPSERPSVIPHFLDAVRDSIQSRR